MTISNPTPISSKLPPRRAENEFYRYYAGYPIEFAQWAIEELELPKGSVMVDPWNGSGTTMAACARLGISCQGYDLNPVMVHLARSRVASASDIAEAEFLIDQVERSLINYHSITVSELAAAFGELPIVNKIAHSAALAALFPYSRSLFKLQKSKNPSWYKLLDKGISQEIIRNDIFLDWRNYLNKLKSWVSNPVEGESLNLSVEQGDCRKSLGRPATFDGVLTSPPYLTRLDYVHATLPEFILLAEFDLAPDMNRLRRSMLGSPLTSSRPKHSLDRLPKNIILLLNRIANHPSKASSTYYHRFFSTYFVDLQASMRSISKVLKTGAKACIVVQSSNYKEIEVDLASALNILAIDSGFEHLRSVEFVSTRSMSLVNSRAHSDAQKPKKETALFFKRI